MFTHLIIAVSIFTFFSVLSVVSGVYKQYKTPGWNFLAAFEEVRSRVMFASFFIIILIALLFVKSTLGFVSNFSNSAVEATVENVDGVKKSMLDKKESFMKKYFAEPTESISTD